MRFRGIVLPAAAVALCTFGDSAGNPAPAAGPPQPAAAVARRRQMPGRPLRVLIYAGLKTHAPGQHDYRSFSPTGARS
jgi:hypothetical protein